MKMPRVVIVGAGFGGLWAARALARFPVQVLLVDRNNYHVFLPLLYQVAAAELEPEEIAYPIRSILRKLPNVRFALADVKKVDLGARVVESADAVIPYDFLILGVGSTTHFFGVPGAAEHAFPLKDMEQAIALRNHLLCCFERAAQESDVDCPSADADICHRWRRADRRRIRRRSGRTDSPSVSERLSELGFPPGACGAR